MFYVTSLDGSICEPLINISNDFKMEQSVDGTFTVSFSCFPSKNNHGYDLLQSEAIITVENQDFRVKQYSNTAFGKTVTAISTFYDHTKTQRHSIFSGSPTLQNQINFVLQGTGWTAKVDSDIANLTNDIDKLGNDNVVSLITKICNAYQCEYMILPNKRLHFAKQVGGDYDYQYRYKHNVSSVVLKEDTTNLTTVIRGYGKDGLEVIYRSQNADVFGELEAEPVRDDRFTDVKELKDYVATQIQDVPDLAIESTIPELTKREIGERIWLIYEPLNVEMQTRILKQTLILREGKLITSSVVFGNSLIKSAIDLFVEQKEQINDNKNYIDETKDGINETIEEKVREISFRFEETEETIQDQYTKITNEYSASITANAQVIRTEMNQKETVINNRIGAQYTQITSEYNSSITQTAQSIRADVSASIAAVNGSIQSVQNYASSIAQKADQIQLTVNSQQTTINGLGTRVTSAESSIKIQDAQISSKVSHTDYNGRTITSLINQDPYAVSISASRINLNGATMVQGKITGSSSIEVNTDLYVGNNIYLGSAMATSTKQIIFNSMARITAGGGFVGADMTISADTLYLDAGTIDFSRAGNVKGLNVQASSVNGYTMTYTTSGGKKYMTFRQYGSYLGQVEIN